MATTINFDLSPKSIKAAIRATEGYQKRLDEACDKFCEIVCKEAREIAQQILASKGLKHSFYLVESIRVEKFGLGWWCVYVDDQNAIYVEYGTGSAGAANPHPNPPAGWKYGRAWYTKADGKPMDELYGWENQGSEEDPYYLTYGQPAKPFWHPMIEQISDEAFLDKCWKEACRSVGL